MISWDEFGDLFRLSDEANHDIFLLLHCIHTGLLQVLLGVRLRQLRLQLLKLQMGFLVRLEVIRLLRLHKWGLLQATLLQSRRLLDPEILTIADSTADVELRDGL